MLVISRKKNEAVHIGDSVVVTVLEVRGDKVRLGIQAARSIPIWRSELRRDIEVGQSMVEIEVELDEMDSDSRISLAYGCPLCGEQHSNRECRSESDEGRGSPAVSVRSSGEAERPATN